MITKHPTLPNKYTINFDLKYKFEDDYQIHIERSNNDNPPSGITLAGLNHIANSIELMLCKLRFQISLLDILPYLKEGDSYGTMKATSEGS